MLLLWGWRWLSGPDNGTHQLLVAHPGTDQQDVLSALCRTSDGEMGAQRPSSGWRCCLWGPHSSSALPWML